MTEEPLRLEVPRRVRPLVVLAPVSTAWALLCIHLGGLVTAMLPTVMGFRGLHVILSDGRARRGSRA